MALWMTIGRKAAGVAGWVRRLAADAGGVAAIEFAFIAPVLLSLYFVTMEVGQGIETNRKVGRVGSMVADLITQQQTISTNQLDAIMKIGGSILQPYNRSRPRIVVNAIQFNDDEPPEAEVVWSREMAGDTFGRGDPPETTTVPEELEIEETFLIRVESYLEYKPVITWTADQKTTLGLAAAFDGISMREVYYLRPRMSHTIPCDDC